MIVIDASAIVELLLHGPLAERIDRRIFRGRESLHAPHLLDLEVAQVLRRHWRRGLLDEDEGQRRLTHLADFSLTRYPHLILLSRVWELRHNLTAYDASYIALAEFLDAPLVTLDSALAKSSGHSARIELIS